MCACLFNRVQFKRIASLNFQKAKTETDFEISNAKTYTVLALHIF